MNILIVEDDISLAHNLQRTFEKKIITNKVTILHSFKSFLDEYSLLNVYDIIITDIRLVGEENSWIDIVKQVRKHHQEIPIVVISSFNDVKRIEKAFTHGANDYLIKPMRLEELELRIMKWFKTYCMTLYFGSGEELIHEGLIYNFSENSFYYNQATIKLTKKSKYILFLLLIHAWKLVKEDLLEEKVWGDRDEFKPRNMRVYILRLKQQLEQYSLADKVITIRWEGYMLK